LAVTPVDRSGGNAALAQLRARRHSQLRRCPRINRFIFGLDRGDNSPTTCGCPSACAFSRAHNGQLHNDDCADRVIVGFAALSAANSPTALRASRGWDLVDVCHRSDNDHAQHRGGSL
jgi:hypothetical protein